MCRFLFFVCFCFLITFQIFPSVGHTKAYSGWQIMDTSMNNICALTFDDGPHPRTVKILDVLKEENVRATFFVLGSQVQYFPKIVRRAYEEGHEIANHAFSHTALTTLSAANVKHEIEHTNRLLAKYDIPKPRYLRPPLGAYDRSTVAILNELDMDLVLWSTDSFDWQGRPDYSNMPNMVGEVLTPETQRGIYLFHDIKLTTARDIKLIIMILRTIGCQQFVTVSEYFDAIDSPEVLAKLRENMVEETAEKKAKEKIEEKVVEETLPTQFKIQKPAPILPVTVQNS